MPRKAVKTITTVTEENQGEVDVEAQAVNQEAPVQPDEIPRDEIAEFIERFGPGSYVRIYRIERTGDRAFLARCELQLWSEEWLQEQYGGGRYVIQIVDGGNRIRHTKHMLIGQTQPAHSPPGFPSGYPQREAGNPPAAATPASDASTLQLQLLIQEMAANRELMMEMIRSQRPSGGMGEIAEVITAVKALMPQANGGGSMESLMSILKTGIEIGKTGTVDTNEGGVMGMLKDALPIVGDVIKGFLPGRNAPVAPAAAPAMATNPADHAAIQGAAPEALQMLQHGISYLKGKIIQGKAVELYADFILDSLEDPQWRPFIGLAQAPYEEFAKLDPELLQLPYRPWFEKLFATVKEALSSPPELEIEPEEKTDGSIPNAATQRSVGN
jgi:hypothetical protein